MDNEANTRNTNKRLLLALAFAVFLLAICGLLTLSRWGRVTEQLQQTAEYALDNPASATIDFSYQGHLAWYPPGRGDYAVENGLVIFPQPVANSLKRAFQDVLPDKTLTALVYAPDGRPLSADPNPGIPDDRSWAYMGEWFLYDCRPVKNHEGWWRCQLLVGGNI